MGRRIRRLAGFVAVVALYVVSFYRAAPWPIVLAGAVVVLYFLFVCPAWCNAVTRRMQLCRNNSSGLLLGCHLRQHKWQKLRMVITPSDWGALSRSMLQGAPNALSSIAAAATLLILVFQTARGVIQSVA